MNGLFYRKKEIRKLCKLGGTHFRISWYNGHTRGASRLAMGTLSAGKVYVSGREFMEDGSRFTGGAAACRVEPGEVLASWPPLGRPLPIWPKLHEIRSCGPCWIGALPVSWLRVMRSGLDRVRQALAGAVVCRGSL